MLLDAPELISDDPRKPLDAQPSDFARLYDEANERHGNLLPGNLVPFLLQVSNQRARQLITGGVFTRVLVCGHEFIPMAEVENRMKQAASGSLSRGGRGHRHAPVAGE